MSLNQSRAERGESHHNRKSGRSGSSGQQRNYQSGGGNSKGGNAPVNPPPPLTTSTNPKEVLPRPVGNRSIKKNGQQGQEVLPRANAGKPDFTSRGAPNGSLNNDPPNLLPLPGSSGSAISGNARQIEATPPKSVRAIPKAPSSNANAGSTESTLQGSPSSSGGDVAKGFALQFGSISPGYVNGMQIPARTSSAPPNLDEQRRAQARHEIAKHGPPAVFPVGKQPQHQHVQPPKQLPVATPSVQPSQNQQQGRKDVSVNQASSGEIHPSHLKRETPHQIPLPPQSSTPKSPILAMTGVSMPMSFQQAQVPLQFSGPNSQMPSQNVAANSLQYPLSFSVGNAAQMQPSLFVSNLQPHALQQGIVHQGQGLKFASQIPHQLGPQMGSLGIGMPPQYSQQPVNKFGAQQQRRSVKITDPKTHEELKLDKKPDSFADATSAQPSQLPRSHAGVPSPSQPPIPSYASPHQLGYYQAMQTNSYGSSMYYPQSSLPLPGSQITPSPSAPRFGLPVTHSGHTVTITTPANKTGLAGAKDHLSSENGPQDGHQIGLFGSLGSTQVNVKPPVVPVGEKVSMPPSASVHASVTNRNVPNEPVRQPSHHEEHSASQLQRGSDGGARLITSALAQIPSIAASSLGPSELGSESHGQHMKALVGLPVSDPLPIANRVSPVVGVPSGSVSSDPVVPIEGMTSLTETEGRKSDFVKRSDSFKDQHKKNRKEQKHSRPQHQVQDPDISVAPSSTASITCEFQSGNSPDNNLVESGNAEIIVEVPSILSEPSTSEIPGVSETNKSKVLGSGSKDSQIHAGGVEDVGDSRASTAMVNNSIKEKKVSHDPPKASVAGGEAATYDVLDDSRVVKEYQHMTSDTTTKKVVREIHEIENVKTQNEEAVASPSCCDIDRPSDALLQEAPSADNLNSSVDPGMQSVSEREMKHPAEGFPSSNPVCPNEPTELEVAEDVVDSLKGSAATSGATTLKSVAGSATSFDVNENKAETGSELMDSGTLVAEPKYLNRVDAVDAVVSIVDGKHEIKNVDLSHTSGANSTARDRTLIEETRPRSVGGKKKKRKDVLSKADAAGTTTDLYMAYKTTEEKHEVVPATENNDDPSSDNKKQMLVDDSEKHVAKDDDNQSKSELDDWEDVVEIVSPKLDAHENGIYTHGNKRSTEHDGGSVNKKIYSRDFLLTFSEQYKDLPAGVWIGPEVAETIMNVQIPVPQIADRETYGRIDRQSTGARLDRRPSNSSMDEERWNKQSPFTPARDMRPDLAYGVASGFVPMQGPNMGVLRNPRGQPVGQYIGGILSGPIPSLPSPGGIPRGPADADRWQRAFPAQKGLIPAPHVPATIMHKAEKKYEIGRVSDEEQAKQRQLKSILNKLTPQNFEKLFVQVKEVNIDNVVTLTGVISQIFDKALMEPTFCEMYADFCLHLSGALPEFFNEDNEKINFKRLLLNKCQEEFEREEREQAEADRAEEGEKKLSPEEREGMRVKARRRMLGNIRLIGELYKKKMLTERIMHGCIQKLLRDVENPDEEDIEALCKLMSTIGVIIDHFKAASLMEEYFDRMLGLSNSEKLSTRLRFMLRDVIDLRKNRWHQRRKVEGPKKIEEVHRDAAQERQAQASRGSRTLGISSSGKRGQPVDYGPRGVGGLSSMAGSQLGSMRGVPPARGFAAQDVRMDDRRSYENRPLSLLATPKPSDESIMLGPQGGLARGMSMRGQPPISDITMGSGENRRYGLGANGHSSSDSSTDWNHHAARDESSTRGFLSEKPIPSTHDQSLDRDNRTADYIVDTPAHASGHVQRPAVVAHDSSEKLLSEEQLCKKSITAIREFYSAKDEKEITTCIKELNAPSFYPTMVSLWVSDSFERSDNDRKLLAKLLINLSKSSNKLLSQMELVKGFESVFSTLNDAIYDAPKAAEFLGAILAKVILEDIFSLKEVGRLIHEGGEEPGSLLESGVGADVLGNILKTVKMEKGESVVKDYCRTSDIRLEEFLPPEPNKSLLVSFI